MTPKFYISTPEAIKLGKTTDIYFVNTKKVLESFGLASQKVVAEFTTDSFPKGCEWGVFCGLEEVLALFEGIKVDLYSLPEGTVFPAWSFNGVRIPVMVISGPYEEFCLYETPALGLICQASGIATQTARMRKLAGDKTLFSFGIRRMHPAISPMIDRAAYIGGCDFVSSQSGAESIGKTPRGTMPHSLIVLFESQKEAFMAFDKVIDKDVLRICLIDTYYDEKAEAIIAAETVPNLFGVRLDTPASRRGDFPEMIKEVRWELDIRGYKEVKLFVSGSIDENAIERLKNCPVDGFGIGTSIANAPTINFAMDIVELEGKPVAKRGKFGGAKETLRCPECFVYLVKKAGEATDKCPNCSGPMEHLLVQYLKDGALINPYPSVDEIRSRTIKELRRIDLCAI